MPVSSNEGFWPSWADAQRGQWLNLDDPLDDIPTEEPITASEALTISSDGSFTVPNPYSNGVFRNYREQMVAYEFNNFLSRKDSTDKDLERDSNGVIYVYNRKRGSFDRVPEEFSEIACTRIKS